jgi:beta-lactam-binding protein with PASTA domain
VNESADKVKKTLTQNGLDVIVIGDGDTIVSQYPMKGSKVVTGDKIFLITNGNTRKMENVIGWSKSDFKVYMNLLGISYEMNGYGYITKQSISSGTTLTEDTSVEVELSNKYQLE